MSTHQSLQDTQPVPELGELTGDGASLSLGALWSLPDSNGQGMCGQCSRGSRELTTLTHSILCVQKSLRMGLIEWILGKSMTRASRVLHVGPHIPLLPLSEQHDPKVIRNNKPLLRPFTVTFKIHVTLIILHILACFFPLCITPLYFSLSFYFSFFNFLFYILNAC